MSYRGGGQVYGMWLDPGYGYNVDITTGVAKGNEHVQPRPDPFRRRLCLCLCS